MKKLLLFILLLLGFSRISEAQTTVKDSMIFGGIMRHYHVYIPKNYVVGSSRPLIMNFHGYGSNASAEQAYSNFMPVADTAGFLVVYPEGLKDGNGNQYWNAGIPGLPKTPDDVAFISSLIDALHLRYNINTSKVYSTGLSNGGYMSYRLAWKLSDKIAAIASVSGSMGPQDFAICKPPRPIPIMEIHGTADPTVPYTGSSIATDIDTLMRFWVLNDHCIPISDPISLPDIDPNDGSNVIHFQWSAEVANITCELYRITGGAHVDWPGAGAGNNMDFSASPTIWQFFNRYQISTSDVKENESVSSSIGFYPNPSSGIIHLRGDAKMTTTVLDMTGRTMITSKEKDIDISRLASGLYILLHEQNGMQTAEKLVKY